MRSRGILPERASTQRKATATPPPPQRGSLTLPCARPGMATFRVDDRVQEDLSFLSSLPAEQFGDFCNIALEFVRRGPNEKLYTRAAGRVGVEPAVVERSIVAL